MKFYTLIAYSVFLDCSCISAEKNQMSATVGQYPATEQIQKIEISDERNYAVILTLKTFHPLAIKEAIGWFSEKIPLPLDPNWNGNRRPILKLRVWLKNIQEPVDFVFISEWKTQDGRIMHIDKKEISLLFDSLYKHKESTIGE